MDLRNSRRLHHQVWMLFHGFEPVNVVLDASLSQPSPLVPAIRPWPLGASFDAMFSINSRLCQVYTDLMPPNRLFTPPHVTRLFKLCFVPVSQEVTSHSDRRLLHHTSLKDLSHHAH